MHKIIIVTPVFIGGFLISPIMLQAQEDENPVAEGKNPTLEAKKPTFKECGKIEDSFKRYQCFDQAAGIKTGEEEIKETIIKQRKSFMKEGYSKKR